MTKALRPSEAGWKAAQEAPVVDINTHELAWAAGFFDGEGWVGAGSNGRARGFERVRVAIGQTKGPELLERFRRAVGAGRIAGPFPQQKPHQAARWMYEESRREAIHLMCWLLWPWLGDVKRQQFDNAFKKLHAMRDERVMRYH